MKNLRDEKGVSLISLVIVIMIMGIIFVVTFSAGKELLDTTKVKKYATVMYLVKAEVEAITDEYDFLSVEGADNSALKNSMFVGDSLSTNNINELYTKILPTEINVTEFNRYYATSAANYATIKSSWKIIKSDHLKAWGINADFIDDVDKVFYVNYVTAEVVYKKGVSIEIVDPITGATDKQVVHVLRTFESM